MLPATYVTRSLQIRWVRSALTIGGVALVVGVFCYLICLSAGLRRTLALTGDPYNLIVLAEGATAESNSALERNEARRLVALPNLAISDDGEPQISPELVVQANVARRGDDSGAFASVTIRGVYPDMAFSVHEKPRLIAGRWFRIGTDELVVGATAAQKFAHTNIGDKIDCGERTFEVVGVFAANGSTHESEFWGYLSNVGAAYRRYRYSSATVRLDTLNEAAIEQTIDRIASGSVALKGQTQAAYYQSQSNNARMIEALALGLVVLMGGGALLAATNTIHASVSGRTREFGVLRVLGYSPRSVFLAVLSESLLLTMLGAVVGCAACAVFLSVTDSTRDLVGTETFSAVAFDVRITPISVVASMIVAVLIGLLAGFWPARKAARLSVIHALRTE